ncbi:NAD(P)-binding protein [Ramicandelaber brevisporus]|nr:NAD(P)-binding protein [Ramicandelaber brevisporus]
MASTTATLPTHTRVLAFSKHGTPADVVTVVDQPLPALGAGDALVRYLVSPINPSDVGAVAGHYPTKPRFAVPPAGSVDSAGNAPAEAYGVGGLEGIAEIIALGPDAKTGINGPVKVGDWVLVLAVFSKDGTPGTWRTHAVTPANQLLVVPHEQGLKATQAGTSLVNPPTAYRLLKDYGLKKGDVVIQNGANSYVGQFVIQLGREWGIKTVNVIRNRDGHEKTADYLKSLGADLVILDSELGKPETVEKVRAVSGNGTLPSVAFDCVAGPAAAALTTLLQTSGTLVNYGGMSGQAIPVSPAHLIMQDLKFVGFWLTSWTRAAGIDARQEMIKDLVALQVQGKLAEPVYQKTILGSATEDAKKPDGGAASRAEVQKQVRLAFQSAGSGDAKQIFVPDASI